MKWKRVWHPFSEWEEIGFNMWGESLDRKADLARAIEFTGNHLAYGESMLRVVKEWPVSAENALTDASLNRRAWVGHAACALALGCPEDVVREAWGHLTNEQRFLANKAADRAISAWEVDYSARGGLYQDMGTALLF